MTLTGHRIAGVALATSLATSLALAPTRAYAADPPPSPAMTARSNVLDPSRSSEDDAQPLVDLPQQPFEHKGLSLGIVGGIYGILYGYTYLAWYSRGEDSPTLQFHDEGWFGMDTYAGGADKIGHMWGNYAIVRGISGILEWGGWSKKMALTTATGMTLGFFVVAEIKDGYKPQYGFSWGDIVFNVSGEALAILFEAQPKLDEMFDFKAEYFPSKAFRDSIGTDGPFNSSEDYTGQRFFLSYHLSTIDALRESRYFGWSEYVDVSVGFQAAHFRPEYADPNDHKQDLFVGLQLNVQRIVDNALMPSPRSGKKPGGGTRALHFTTEIVQVPFTTLRVGGVERTAPGLDPPTGVTTTAAAPVRAE